MPEQPAQLTEAPPEAGIEMAELGTSHSSGGGQPLLDSGGEAQVPGASRGAQRRCCSTLVLSRSVLVGTLVLVLAASGIAIWQLVDRHAENHIVAWFVGGIFTALSVVCAPQDHSAMSAIRGNCLAPPPAPADHAVRHHSALDALVQ